MTDRSRALAVLALGVALVAHPPVPAAAPSTDSGQARSAPALSFTLGAPTPAPSPGSRHGILGTALRISGMVRRLNDPRKPVRWSFSHGQLSVSIRTP